jgi:hypothetical protein
MKAQKRSTNEQFMPGIFNKTGYEFIYNPEDKKIYALTDGQKIPFEDIDDKLFLIDLDEEVKNNKSFQKGIEDKGLATEEKRWQFAFCFLCGYDGSLDYEDSVFQYDHNKYCEQRECCPFGNMCEKAVEYGGVKLSRREHQIIVMISKEEKKFLYCCHHAKQHTHNKHPAVQIIQQNWRKQPGWAYEICAHV